MSMKRILSMVLTLGLVMTLAAVPANAAGTASMMNFAEKQTYTEGQFTDVKAADWYRDGVAKMYALGLMNGTSGNTFSPDKAITAPEIYLLMARLENIYSGGSGELVGDDWQTRGKNYLDEKNLAIDLHANADGTVARAYVMGQLVKVLPASEFAAINTIEKLPDVDGNTPYSAEILTLYNAGVLTGGDKYGTFAPDKAISRGELATLLVRVIEPTSRKSFTPAESSLEGYTGVGVNTDLMFDVDNPLASLPNTKLVVEKYGVNAACGGDNTYVYLNDGSVSMRINEDEIIIRGFDYSANLPSKYYTTCALIRDVCDKESADALISWLDELESKRNDCLKEKISDEALTNFYKTVFGNGGKTQFGNIYVGGTIDEIKISK